MLRKTHWNKNKNVRCAMQSKVSESACRSQEEDSEQLVALALNLDYADENEFEDVRLLNQVSVQNPRSVTQLRLANLAASQPTAALKVALGPQTQTASPTVANCNSNSHMLTQSCFALLRTQKGQSDFPLDNDDETRNLMQIAANADANFGLTLPPGPDTCNVSPSAERDADCDDLTNLSWLQNANLLQQMHTNDAGATSCKESQPAACVLVNVHDSGKYVLLGDAEVQASQFVTVGEREECATDEDAALFERPPFSLNALIFMAIESSALKCLPVRDIYDWIVTQFPYYRRAPSGWKNSIRHTLSLGRCFKRFIADPVHDAEKELENAARSSRAHLSAFAKGSLWMVDADQRPALIQGLHRTLWELERAARSRSRPVLFAPSSYLAPLLQLPLFAPELDARGPTSRKLPKPFSVADETEKKIMDEMALQRVGSARKVTFDSGIVIEDGVVTSPIFLTPVKAEPAYTTSDADMNAVHALVALKSAATATLEAFAVQAKQMDIDTDLKPEVLQDHGHSECTRARARSTRRRHAKGGQKDQLQAPHADHQYSCATPSPGSADCDASPWNCNIQLTPQSRRAVASDADSICVPMYRSVTPHMEVVSASGDAKADADSLFSSSRESSVSPPLRNTEECSQSHYRLVRDSRGLLSAAQCIVFSSASSPSSTDDRVDVTSASSRRIQVPISGGVGRRLTRSAAAARLAEVGENANVAQDSAQRKRKKRSVLNKSWKEYRRILSRRRSKTAEQTKRSENAGDGEKRHGTLD